MGVCKKKSCAPVEFKNGIDIEPNVMNTMQEMKEVCSLCRQNKRFRMNEMNDFLMESMGKTYKEVNTPCCDANCPTWDRLVKVFEADVKQGGLTANVCKYCIAHPDNDPISYGIKPCTSSYDIYKADEKECKSFKAFEPFKEEVEEEGSLPPDEEQLLRCEFLNCEECPHTKEEFDDPDFECETWSSFEEMGGTLPDSEQLNKPIIYTSRITHTGPDSIDITVKSAKGIAKKFAPTWDMVKKYKEGKLSKLQYTRKYARMINRLKAEDFEELIGDKKRIILTCYCKAGEFCHRTLLAKFLEQEGYGIYGGEI
ncbi:MAG: hypothetical protein NWF07_13830 [Candidatus Bathyarchaeota archaeon]|nr:hypothetical protein [Candidatus Bathyarchaeota archaeon]